MSSGRVCWVHVWRAQKGISGGGSTIFRLATIQETARHACPSFLAPPRFAEARAKRPELELDYSFVATPELGLSEWKEPAPYDAVTCMFAAHYFFVSEAALKQFLHNVSINLVQGGYFFGTVPDGRRVNDCVLAGQGMRFHSPMLTVEARWKGAPECFGSAYICAIGDTVTGGMCV